MPEVMLLHLKEEFEVLFVETIFVTIYNAERWDIVADRINAHAITANILVVFSLYTSMAIWTNQAFTHNCQRLISNSLLEKIFCHSFEIGERQPS